MTASVPACADTRLLALREAGAARVDAVGWHYLEVLAERTRTQKGTAQALLQGKMDKALDDFQARLDKFQAPPADCLPAQTPPLSPLKALVQDMTAQDLAPSPQPTRPVTGGPAERPRVRQFRQQLRKISVHKQVSQAIAQAPNNAGPINSHMLVLRSLGLMRDISGDYLNRFMAHLETLLCLEEAEKNRLPAKKTPGRTKKS
jgi:hypothetical protein